MIRTTEPHYRIQTIPISNETFPTYRVVIDSIRVQSADFVILHHVDTLLGAALGQRAQQLTLDATQSWTDGGKCGNLERNKEKTAKATYRR